MQTPSDLKLPLTGSRLRVRRLTLGDIEPLFAIESDPVVKRYLNGAVQSDRRTWINEMRNLCSTTNILAVELRQNGELIGRTLLSPEFPLGALEMQIILARRTWGNRYGREVAQLLINHADETAARVVAVVNPDNTSSLSLLRHFNFNFSEAIDSPGWQNGHHKYYRLPSPLPQLDNR